MFGLDETAAPDPGAVAPEAPWAMLMLFPLLALALVAAAIIIVVATTRYTRRLREEADRVSRP